MEEKKKVLLKVAYLIELPEEEVNNDNGLLDKIIGRIGEDKNLIIDKNEIEVKWNSTTSMILESDELNCGKCINCGQWTTDRDSPDAIKGLCNGARIDGKLFCDECLPSDHRWAF